MARKLYTSKEKRIPQPAATEIHRRFIKGYTQHIHDPEIQQLSKSVKQYSQRLDQLGFHDHQVHYARFSYVRTLGLLLYRLGKLLLLSVATLPGLTLFSPVFVAARYYSHKKRRQALAASTVKVRGHDVVATWKILIAAGLAPLLYTYYAILLVLWTRYNQINHIIPPNIPTYWIVAAAYFVFPTITYAALRLGEGGMDILKSLWPLLLCLSSKSNIMSDLRRRRADLARHVTDVVDRLGPDMFSDCEREKIPFPRRIYADISPFDTLEELLSKEVVL
jgi:glycerol-3-phosphate O-acyltransferase/dihydroxyacetone phosphate acyltransferase